jgi:sugar phosphate isomerase/epimerase
VEKAIAWNCDLVRVFTFLRKNTPSTSADLKAAASHFPKLLEVVKGTNVRIGIENEFSTVVGNGVELKEFLKLVNSTVVGGVWDPCNIVFMPGAADPIEVDFPLVADQVMHVHVKDAKRANGKPAEHCIEVGTGEINFPKLLSQLKTGKFKGWVSLETHWRQKALSTEESHLPAGYSFSANAEPASRICMGNLQKMLQKL